MGSTHTRLRLKPSRPWHPCFDICRYLSFQRRCEIFIERNPEGTYDWQCNWVANKLWVDKLEWSGSDVYRAEEWEDWFVGGGKAGEAKQTPLLSFVTIRGAGHMMSILILILLPWHPDIFFLFTSLMINLQNLWRWYQNGWLVKRCDVFSMVRYGYKQILCRLTIAHMFTDSQCHFGIYL